MKTEAPPTLEAAPAPSAPASLKTWVVPTIILSGVAGILLAFFLSIYPIKGFTTPIGWDASEYLWRTRVAQELGLDRTTNPLPSAARPKSGRPGYLVIGSTLS